MSVEPDSSTKGRWKRGLSQLRRQSTVSELSATFGGVSIMEEDGTENEMQDYLTGLKKKTGLNMLWSGRKFAESIDKNPDIDISEPVIRNSFQDMTLDSDEEDLHKFIQNLTDDEKEEIHDSSKSSESEINLMKNMNFAELGSNAYGSHHKETDDDGDDDFMPRIVKANFQHEDSDKEQSNSLSSTSNIFKKNVNFIDSDLDAVTSQSSSTRESLPSVVRRSEIVDDDLSEEIMEVYDESRTKTPAKSNEYNYTFDSYDSEKPPHTKDSQTKNSKSGSYSKDQTDSESHRSSLRSSSDADLDKKSKKDKKSRSSRDKNKSRSSVSSSSSFSSRSTSSSSKTEKDSSSRTEKENSSRTEKDSSPLVFRKASSLSIQKVRSPSRSHGTKSCSTQTRKPEFNSNLLLSNNELLKPNFVFDPSPIAPTVVSNEALQAVASFNPSTLAMNDLLKFQLDLTRQHIDNSWRLYRAYTAPGGSYKYTTLKDTMKYIKQNAPTVISYEEALKQVTENDF